MNQNHNYPTFFETLERRQLLSAVVTPVVASVTSSPQATTNVLKTGDTIIMPIAGQSFTGIIGTVSPTGFGVQPIQQLPAGQSNGAGEVFYLANSNADPTCTVLTVSVNWGDGTSGPITLVADSAGGYDVHGTHTYATSGIYTISISDEVQVGYNPNYDGPPVLVMIPFIAEESQLATSTALVGAPTPQSDMTTNKTFNDTLGSVPYQPGTGLAPGTIIPPNANDSTYLNRVSIDWGDGSTSPATLVVNGQGQFEILGTHSYPADGTYQVSISGQAFVTNGFETGQLSFSRYIIVTDTSVTLENAFNSDQGPVVTPFAYRPATASSSNVFSSTPIGSTATSILYSSGNALGDSSPVLG